MKAVTAVAVVFLLALGVSHAQTCQPSTFYVLRHAERFFAAAGNGVDDSQEILTPEGFVRARALRDKFVDEELPIDAFFVSTEFIRSYQTAAPLEALLDVPVRRYDAESPNSQDIADQVAAMDPCPQHAMIITHGNFIVELFAALGADASDVPNITDFGFVFTLTFPNGEALIETSTYGVPESNGDVNFPPVVIDPNQVTCQPSKLYVFRHAERFRAAAGNGEDDSQEVLTLDGFQRARDLRQKFIDEHLPLDHIMVSDEFIRSHQTAAPTEALFQVPVTRIEALSPNQQDLADQIAVLNPCPENVMVVTHGDFIVDALGALGFPDAADIPGVSDFGQFFTLTFPDGVAAIDQSTYGVPESTDNVPFPIVKTGQLPSIEPNGCRPTTLYIFRHAERFFAAAGNGADDSQEILSPEGFARARALRDLVLEQNIPIDAIFVSDEFVRSYQTVAPLEAELVVPVRRIFALGDLQADLAVKVAAMSPCPENAMIITHGDFIVQVFAALGADATQIPDVTDFGKIFTMTFPNGFPGVPQIIETTYGVEESAGDVDFPPIEIDPNLVTCEPSRFYVLRHAERFRAADGNGADDSQETLTADGFQRARDLAKKFTDEHLPLDAIFVSAEFIRTLQTASPTEEIYEVPITKYQVFSPNQQDLTDQIAVLNPCPQNVMIVTHGDVIVDIFAAIGFDASEVEGVGDFGQFFTVDFDENRNPTLDTSTYGVAESTDNVPFPVVQTSILPPFIAAPACKPSTYHIFRHAERFFAAAGNGADDSQEILSPEGFVRARALRDLFVEENIPLDAIFVSNETVRSYLTAALVEEEYVVPVREILARSPNSEDAAVQIANMDPCPQDVLVITHGDFIVELFARLGADVSQILDITDFGFIFTMTFDEQNIPHIVETTYGVAASNGDVNSDLFLDPSPNPDVCEPSTFYILRHGERFIAANGNGADDCQEVLTPEGLQRARDLRQKFMDEHLPLDEIFVSNEFVRTLQTASPTEFLFQVPVAEYSAFSPNQQDLADKIATSNPCPDNVLIVTHGEIIVDVFNALGFDASQVPDVTDFGKFFTLFFDADRVGTVAESTYGVAESSGNIPFSLPGASQPTEAPASAQTGLTNASSATAGIVVLVIGLLVAATVVFWYLRRASKKKKAEQHSEQKQSYAELREEIEIN